MHVTVIFPDQLFKNHPGIAKNRTIYLVEEFLYFKVQPFHKQRLLLLRAAMRAYEKSLLKAGHKVIYVHSCTINQRGDLFAILAKAGVQEVYLAELSDVWLSQDLSKASQKYQWKVHFYPSPGFICSQEEISDFFSNQKHYSMARFYAHQRKNLNILMDDRGPIGNKFSFDTENRKKLPKNLALPTHFIPKSPPDHNQLIDEIEQEFPNAVGEANPLFYAHTHAQARLVLDRFLKEKLFYFGDYQDAMHMQDSFLFHSVLSPLLNTGLVTPSEVVETTLAYAKENSIPLNSLEGFLRQIIGWREFVRASYLLKGAAQRSINFFKHHDKIPKSFSEGSTGVLPIDTVVKHVLKTGYCNHIERLMVLGNFLLLTESAPDEIYRWFMTHFVDAYDWVMVPNIYGMSQYADGGQIITKPYVSSSNYLLKMSNYSKGPWTEIWDGLYWRFLHIHSALFASNPRTLNLINLFKKNESTISPKIHKAEQWLKDYRKAN